MSAIFGIINQNDQPVDRANLDRMSAALEHHGCDGGCVWTTGAVGLGQRLMCFTPEDRLERQPLLSADGQYVLVSDGRVDNRPDLISDLGLRIVDSGFADGELILRAYERWGEDCLRHLVGVFAFAIWDAAKQRLFAARSPIVAPPLHYHCTPQVFAFATMPKGMLALSFVPRAINEQKLADGLVQSPAEPEATLYQGIYRLPTGSWLSFGRRGMKVHRYWQPDLQREIRFRRDEEYIEAFKELLDRVASDYLRSLTPVGIMMSGGLDSSSVAATAARLLGVEGKRLTAFTEVPRTGFDGPVPPGRYADETPLVQAVAAMHDNLDLNLIRTDGRTFLDGLDQLFYYLELPFRNTSNRAWIEAIYQQARQRGIRAVLDGTQGNLTFSWMGSGLMPRLLRSGRWARALREARGMAQRGVSRSALRALVGQGILPLLPTPLWLAVERLRGNALTTDAHPWRVWTPIHPDFAATHKVEERARDREHDFHFRLSTDSRGVCREALASQDTGAYMPYLRSLFGVDPRTPPADVRIAEFCLALPEEQFMRDGEPRSLIRRAMADCLPPEVLSNQKRGLQAADWFERLTSVRDRLPAELDRLEQCDLARRALDLERMRHLVEHWPQEGCDHDWVVFDYNCILERGLMVGRFLRWFEENG